jgi:predicted phosphate transport protein (TIGR00153 family)
MFDFIKKIMPREDKFFDMFEAHAAKSVEAAGHLRAALNGGNQMQTHIRSLMKAEDEADRITDQVIDGLRKSFITPFDRVDIQNLITDMDDAIDQMNKTAKAILLFEVNSFEPDMLEMADDAVKMAKLLQQAIPLLRKMGANSGALHEITGKILAIEDDSDRRNEAGLKALIKGKAKKDAMAYIIGAEIYDHLEKCGDSFEDVAQTLSGIVVEHV